MADLTSALTSWAGDVSALVRMKANFRAAVHVGDEMVAGGTVSAIDEARKVAKLDVWVTVDRGGETEYAIRRSQAEVQLS